jgi:hypothetical protein
MTKHQLKELLDRVPTWPDDDQEKFVQFAREIERRLADDDITDAEWRIIEQRASRRDLATDEDVENLFRRFRRA